MFYCHKALEKTSTKANMNFSNKEVLQSDTHARRPWVSLHHGTHHQNDSISMAVNNNIVVEIDTVHNALASMYQVHNKFEHCNYETKQMHFFLAVCTQILVVHRVLSGAQPDKIGTTILNQQS